MVLLLRLALAATPGPAEWADRWTGQILAVIAIMVAALPELSPLT